MDVRKYISDTFGLIDLQLLEKLESCACVRLVRKGELLQKSGEKAYYTSFLVRGIFRGFYYDSNGVDVTDCFACSRGDALVSCLGLEEPSVINIEALENGEILTFPTAVLLEQMEHKEELLALYNRLLRSALRMHWENKVALTNRTARDRYEWFQLRFPGLIDRISHKYVASFLGMTPVSLSRVRRITREAQSI